MIRILIESIILFCLPAFLYVVFVMLRDGGSRSAGVVLNEAPLGWLALAGGVCVFSILVIFQTSSGGNPGQTYHPAVVRDGKVVPGTFK